MLNLLFPIQRNPVCILIQWGLHLTAVTDFISLKLAHPSYFLNLEIGQLHFKPSDFVNLASDVTVFSIFKVLGATEGLTLSVCSWSHGTYRKELRPTIWGPEWDALASFSILATL